MFKEIELIEYLEYFIEYLDESIFKDLIGLIFNKKKFIIKPFDSYKAFFIFLLSPKRTKILYGNDIKYEDLICDKEEIVSLQNEGVLEDDQNTRSLSDYYRLKCAYMGVKNLNDVYLGYDDIPELMEYYNDLFIPTENSDEIIFYYMKYIVESLSSCNNVLSKKKSKSNFKKFLSTVIKNLILNKYCYIIHESFEKGIYEVQKNIFKPITGNNAKIKSESYKIEKAVINFKSYNKLVKTIDKAVENLYKKRQKGVYCHICNPYDNPSQEDKKQKCRNCEKIYELICEIDDSQNTKKIGARIKRVYKEEKKLTFIEKKERHYKNLISFVKKLRKVKTNISTEKFDTLNKLIDSAFGKDKK